jgi:hypothetical protein
MLYGAPEPDETQLRRGIAGWALVHGIATLWLNGNLPSQLGDDPEQIARIVAAQLGPGDPGAAPPPV